MGRSFRILETLGEGAYGAVHRAEARDDDGFVQVLAVKWLHARWSHDAELASRLRDEARLLALLDHEHIVRVHGITRIDGRLAITMEAVRGVDLSRLPTPPVRAAVEIGMAVADALDAAWRLPPPGRDEPLRVVHRDVKPSNIMVTERGGVRVLDFGVARATFEARESSTRSQQFGTARYMAPERWLHGVAEAPSDVWSLGVTLAEVLGGAPVERPRLSREGFEEDMGQALAPLEAHGALGELVRAMCAWDPEDRPTAEQVVARLRALLPTLTGPGLREWAPDAVAAAQELPPGEAVGSVVQEDSSARTFAPVGTLPAAGAVATLPVPPRARSRWTEGIVAVLTLLVAVWVGWPRPAPVPVEAVAPEEVAPEEALVLPAPVEVATEAPPEPEAPMEPDALPEPEPAAPPPRRVARPKVEVPVAAEEPPRELTPVRFRFDPSLAVSTSEGEVRPNRALELPLGTQSIAVRDGTGRWSCTVRVGRAPSTVVIDRDGRRCDLSE